jgi:hypothetical protein
MATKLATKRVVQWVEAINRNIENNDINKQKEKENSLKSCF